MNQECLWTPNKALHIPDELLVGMEHELGADGPGVVALSNVVDPQFLSSMLVEMANPAAVSWRDAGSTYVNGRGIEVVQNHDVFALKAGGDFEPIWNVPCMAQLAIETEDFVQSLNGRYPSLEQWRADEMAYHRYYNPDVGLSYHRDNLRFTGLIVVITISGESDFQVVDRAPLEWTFDEATERELITAWDVHNEWVIPTKPGDMVITRATGLQSWMTKEHNPEHAVMNVRDLPRISFMVRANSRPADQKYGFTYNNWPD